MLLSSWILHNYIIAVEDDLKTCNEIKNSIKFIIPIVRSADLFFEKADKITTDRPTHFSTFQLLVERTNNVQT